MELFCLDVETCGTHKNFESFQEHDFIGSKLFEKKCEKMGWITKYGDVHSAYYEQSPIVSTYGRICCISFGYTSDSGEIKISSYYGENEKEIVEKFNDLLKRIELKSFNISGYRITHFDIPWVLHKLHKYRIKPASIITPYGKKPWDLRITDMADDFKQKFAYMYSFDEVCYELGIDSPKEKMDGSMVHSKYWKGEYDEIKDYCELDVAACIEVSRLIY